VSYFYFSSSETKTSHFLVWGRKVTFVWQDTLEFTTIPWCIIGVFTLINFGPCLTLCHFLFQKASTCVQCVGNLSRHSPPLRSTCESIRVRNRLVVRCVVNGSRRSNISSHTWLHTWTWPSIDESIEDQISVYTFCILQELRQTSLKNNA